MNTKKIKIPDIIKECTNDILNNIIKQINNNVNDDDDDDDKKMESEDYYIEHDYVNENMEYEIILEDKKDKMFDDDKNCIKKMLKRQKKVFKILLR